MPAPNIPEKIASLYLRLNGFLQLPLFTLFYEDRHGQIDIVALRAGNSVETAMTSNFIVDEELFNNCKSESLPDPKGTTFGLVVEVRGNKRRKAPAVEDAEYAEICAGGELVPNHFDVPALGVVANQAVQNAELV